MSKKFEVGKTYSTRSICDYDCIFSITILSRTDKSIRFERHGKIKTCRVSTYDDGIEMVKAFGSYSMCPIFTAEKEG